MISYNPTNRAKQLQAFSKAKGKFADRNVVSYLETKEGPKFVTAGPTKDFEPEMKRQLRDDEELVRMNRDDRVGSKKWGVEVPRDQRIHPENRLLVHTALRGLTPSLLQSSLAFCPSCVAIIEAFGGRVVSPFKAVFGK